MKLISANFAIFASIIAFSSQAAHADEMKVTQAKFAMGDALTKMALLTNSLTEKGKQHPGMVGMQMAQQFSVKLDDLISSGLQHDASCEKIIEYSDQQAEKMFDSTNDKNVTSAAAKRSVEGVKASIHDYVSAQCENLNG